MRMYKKVVASLVMATLLASSISAQQPTGGMGGLLVSPGIQRVDSRPGATGTINFELYNPNTAPTIATIELTSFLPKDWSYDAQLNKPHARDASSWLKVPPETYRFDPYQQQVRGYSYTIPRSAKGTYWCMLRISPRPASGASTNNVVFEVPIIFNVGSGYRPNIKLQTPIVTANPVKTESSLVLTVPMLNLGDGNAVITATGDIRPLEGGRIIKTFDVPDKNLLPQSKRYIIAELPKVSDGKYRVTMRMNVNSRTLPRIKVDFAVVKGKATGLDDPKVLEMAPISIEPPAFALDMPAGAIKQQALRIRNNGTKPITLQISANSVEQASNGALGASELPPPQGLTVTIDPVEMVLQPNELGSSRLQIGVDKSAKGDLWMALSVAVKGSTTSLREMITGNVMVSKTADPKMEVTDLQLVKAQGRPIQVRFNVKNTGNKAVAPVATAAILDRGVQVVNYLEVPRVGDGGVIPGATVANSVMLPIDIKPGEYVVEISYQYTPQLTAKGRLPLSVVKPVKKTK
ncbi:MAG: COG1470 family protein [Armatimonadota bacterium]